MILQANTIHRKAGVAILAPDKIDFKITKVTRDKDGHFTIIKGTLRPEDIMLLLSIYAPNHRPMNYIKQLLIELKGERD